MQNRKIWIVTELFHPDETAVAFIFTRIANYLSKNYDVNVICGPEFYDKNKIDFKDDNQISEKISVYRTSTINLDKNSLIQRSLKIIILSFQMFFLVIKKVSKGEIILLATNPAPLLLLMGTFKKWKKYQLHILVHDVFPENTIPAQIFKSEKSLIYRFLKFIFDGAYSKADHLIVIGRDMKEVLIQKTTRIKNTNSVSVVTNWSNLKDLKPADKSQYPNYNMVNHRKIILQYSGNIGRVQGLDVLINAFELSNNPNIHLIFRGTGALYSNIERIILSKNIKNVTLLGSYSRNEEYEILSNCDISIVSLSNGMYGLGVPSKTYNLLSAGKPILFLGDTRSEISLMIIENDIGWSFDIKEKDALVEFLNNLNYEDLSLFQTKGRKARSLAEADYEENNVLALFQTQMEKHFI